VNPKSNTPNSESRTPNYKSCPGPVPRMGSFTSSCKSYNVARHAPGIYYPSRAPVFSSD